MQKHPARHWQPLLKKVRLSILDSLHHHQPEAPATAETTKRKKTILYLKTTTHDAQRYPQRQPVTAFNMDQC